MRLARTVAVTTLSLAAAGSTAAQTGDFHVNTYTTGYQYGPSAAILASGDFVVAWHGVGADDGSGVTLNRFTPAGVPLDAEVRVNTYTPSFQYEPAVAAEASGGFVVVWSSFGQDGEDGGIFGQRYDAAGAPLEGEFRVNTYTRDRQYAASVRALPAGGFVVAWTSNGADGDNFGVSARRYDAAGVAIGDEFQVNTYTTYAQMEPDMAVDGTGAFVVVWTSAAPQDGSSFGVFAQRYDAAGARVGGEFQVNTYTTGLQGGPAAAADDAGRFVVVWSSYGGQDGSFSGVFGQRFDASAAPDGGEFRVSTYTTDDQRHPVVAWDGQGHFVVSWTDEAEDGSGEGVFARRFRADGAPLGPEFQVNTYTYTQQLRPSLAVKPDGSLLAAFWDGPAREGNLGVFARHIPDLVFEDGVDSCGLDAWSSASTDGGDLSASAAAAIAGACGLQGVVDDTAGLYVQDDTPQDEGRYRARFYVDPNGFDPGESAGSRRTRIFIAFQEAPTRRLMAVVLRRVNGQYGVMGRARLDDNSQADTGFFAITDAPHAVEIAWTRASTSDTNDGTFELWIDGTLVSTLSGLDNHAGAVDFARLGALSVKAAATGTLYWDGFESRRVSYVGPLF